MSPSVFQTLLPPLIPSDLGMVTAPPLPIELLHCLQLLNSPLHLCQEALYKYTCTCLVASVMSDCVTLWTVTHQAPLSTGFSRQEYWSGLTCPPSGDLPDPGIESLSHMLLHW